MAISNRLNFLIGFGLISIVSTPAGLIVWGDTGKFSPRNAWLQQAYLLLLVCGFVASMIGLARKAHWGYCAWSQIVLSYLLVAAYIGWIRRESNFRIYKGEDGSPLPIATVPGVLRLALLWLVVALLPVAVRSAIRWIRNRRRE
jgi:hypothetical protein